VRRAGARAEESTGGRPGRAARRGPADSAAERALRRLELTITRKLDGLMLGDHLGLLNGPGTEMAESREYAPGDDVRLMDWAVTARTTVPHVHDLVADRELETWVLVDLSSSMDFGTATYRKRDLAVAAVAAIGFLTARTGNRTGAAVLTDTGLHTVAARSGRDALWDLVRDLSATVADGPLPERGPSLRDLLGLDAAPAGRSAEPSSPTPWTGPAAAGGPAAPGTEPASRRGVGGLLGRRNGDRRASRRRRGPERITDLARAIEAVQAPPKRRGVFVVVSDFLTEPGGWAPALRALGLRQQLLAVEIIDPVDERMPDVGLLPVRVPETGELLELPTSSRRWRARYETAAAQHRAAVAEGIRASGASHLTLRTDGDWLDAFVSFAAASRRGRAAGRGGRPGGTQPKAGTRPAAGTRPTGTPAGMAWEPAR